MRSDASINTVNQEYLKNSLVSKKYIHILDSGLAFGERLTNDTYLDWILERTPRMFLILNRIGVPGKVFEAIDRSLADDDLPLSQDNLEKLDLFKGKSKTLNQEFYREQFNFLIQEIKAGGHFRYSNWDFVPVETTAKFRGITTNISCDQVRVYNQVYTRKKVSTLGNNWINEKNYIMDLKHPHLVSVWATYSHNDLNYILLTPPSGMTLKTFLNKPPKAFKKLQKDERGNIFLTWCLCLTSALAFLHGKSFTHQTLCPSAIIVNYDNSIYINNYKALKALDMDEPVQPYNSELYDHSAPENCLLYLRLIKPLSPGVSGATSASSNTVMIHSKSVYSSDLFSLTTILLMLLSMILQRSPESFATHRCRFNRQTASPDASFHKNLPQVMDWIKILAREAGQRKKNKDFWGAVVELAQFSQLGIQEDPKDRIYINDLEKLVAGCVNRGLGQKCKCHCVTEMNGSSGVEVAKKFRDKLQKIEYFRTSTNHLF